MLYLVTISISQHSSQVAVPLILHSLTLPSGAEIFWRLIDDDFTDDDWR